MLDEPNDLDASIHHLVDKIESSSQMWLRDEEEMAMDDVESVLSLSQTYRSRQEAEAKSQSEPVTDAFESNVKPANTSPTAQSHDVSVVVDNQATEEISPIDSTAMIDEETMHSSLPSENQSRVTSFKATEATAAETKAASNVTKRSSDHTGSSNPKRAAVHPSFDQEPTLVQESSKQNLVMVTLYQENSDPNLDTVQSPSEQKFLKLNRDAAQSPPEQQVLKLNRDAQSHPGLEPSSPGCDTTQPRSNHVSSKPKLDTVSPHSLGNRLDESRIMDKVEHDAPRLQTIPVKEAKKKSKKSAGSNEKLPSTRKRKPRKQKSLEQIAVDDEFLRDFDGDVDPVPKQKKRKDKEKSASLAVDDEYDLSEPGVHINQWWLQPLRKDATVR